MPQEKITLRGKNLLLFLAPLVVDDLQGGFVDERNSLFLCNVHHLRERGFQENARDFYEFCARLVRELYLGVDARSGVFHRLPIPLFGGDFFGHGLFEAGIPKICAVAVAVVHGHRGEVLRLHAVYDGVVVPFLHQNFIDFQNEVRAEFARNPVEVAVGRFVPFEATRFVEVRVFERIVPCAFEHLKRLGNHFGAFSALRFRNAVLQRENAVFHLLRRGIAGEAEPNRFFEEFSPVGNKVEGNLFRPQQILRRVGAVPTFEDHGVIILARNVVGEAERVGAEVGVSAFVERPRKDRGHRKICRGLVKVIDDSQIFET